jgi:hypothetical protein
MQCAAQPLRRVDGRVGGLPGGLLHDGALDYYSATTAAHVCLVRGFRPSLGLLWIDPSGDWYVMCYGLS